MLAPDVVESAEKRVGETLGGKWHLDRVIGVGGMAAVYEATHRNRNRVAIKLLHPALSLEDGTRQRFLREGYVANTLRHDGAVQVLDDDVTPDGVAFLVMELLRGESVEEYMTRKGGVIDVRESLSIAEQVLAVLEAAHDQHVVHRDIKPDNLFITETGKLKVLDFGIARLNQGNSRTTKVGSFMGTPAFCAQEQARGRWDEVDHRTDLYSVGATLFTCLTGRHVHEAETSSEQLALAIGATARSLVEVMPQAPTELVELVDMALAYDKEDRFQSARAMRAAVHRVLAGLPVVRKLSTPAPPSGARTFGPTEIDPESIPPAALLEGPAKTRILLGVLVASLLAIVIFIVSKPQGPSGKARIEVIPPMSAVTNAREQASPAEVQPVATPKAPPPEVAEPRDRAVAANSPSSSPDAANSRPATDIQGATSNSKPGVARPSASFASPDTSLTSPSEKPSQGSGDEGMFDNRY